MAIRITLQQVAGASACSHRVAGRSSDLPVEVVLRQDCQLLPIHWKKLLVMANDPNVDLTAIRDAVHDAYEIEYPL